MRMLYAAALAIGVGGCVAAFDPILGVAFGLLIAAVGCLVTGVKPKGVAVVAALVILAVLAGPALAQVTVQTAQPVSPTAIDIGAMGAAALNWVLALFGGIISLFVVNLLAKVLQGVGVNVTDARKAQFQSLILNGLNRAALIAGNKLGGGKLTVDVKSELVAETIKYVYLHGGDIMKSLGIKPGTTEAVSAIEARVALALNDPKQPTPPEITPPEGKPDATFVSARTA